MQAKLDRMVCSMDWRLLFPAAEVVALPPVGSDHCPLMLNTSPVLRKLSRPFIFEAFWNEDSECRHIISKAWNSGDLRHADFNQQVKNVTAALLRWSRRKFSNGQQKLVIRNS